MYYWPGSFFDNPFQVNKREERKETSTKMFNFRL